MSLTSRPLEHIGVVEGHSNGCSFELLYHYLAPFPDTATYRLYLTIRPRFVTATTPEKNTDCAGNPLCYPTLVVAWLSGSALVWINGVTLRRARLMLGWVTVYG